MDNDNKEILSEGLIYYGPGTCPKCFSPLVVLDIETNAYELTIDGYPKNIKTKNKCVGICTKCDNHIDMMMYKGKYVPYSESLYIYSTFEQSYEAEKRLKELRKTSKVNPLAKD